jgi:hypothetical protein
MNRRKFLGTIAGAAVAGRIAPARAAREILVAEPVHSTGYLPLYIAMAKGYFEDVTVKIVTIETGGGHTNAVLSGQAFAFIGSPGDSTQLDPISDRHLFDLIVSQSPLCLCSSFAPCVWCYGCLMGILDGCGLGFEWPSN